ncbi:hypothetical protein CSOJ01_02558 [Colletotrichum sojae]|uniref:Uncharacterized protein n=1 Tax=Colletotrichum sojae TaxID=2175907 RepID=A0A8H6JQH7_9PEZI|nr:hypothetical protein CSOJ01_02558 [Colletotrichum sojae]
MGTLSVLTTQLNGWRRDVGVPAATVNYGNATMLCHHIPLLFLPVVDDRRPRRPRGRPLAASLADRPGNESQHKYGWMNTITYYSERLLWLERWGLGEGMNSKARTSLSHLVGLGRLEIGEERVATIGNEQRSSGPASQCQRRTASPHGGETTAPDPPAPCPNAAIEQMRGGSWIFGGDGNVVLSPHRAGLGSQGSRVAGQDMQDRTRRTGHRASMQRSAFRSGLATLTGFELTSDSAASGRLGPGQQQDGLLQCYVRASNLTCLVDFTKRGTQTRCSGVAQDDWIPPIAVQMHKPTEKQYSKRGGSSLDTMPAVQLNLRPRRSTSWAVDSSPSCRAAAPWHREWRMGLRIPMGCVSLGRYAGVDVRYERQPAKIPGAPVTNRQEEVQIGLCPMGHPCRTLSFLRF